MCFVCLSLSVLNRPGILVKAVLSLHVLWSPAMGLGMELEFPMPSSLSLSFRS